MGPAHAARLSGNRLHLQHGPIDLVIKAEGAADAVNSAYAAASAHFPRILPTLVEELSLLRAPLGRSMPRLRGPVARRMAHACWPHRAAFITPMAAVAGAVAEEVLAVMTAASPLEKALVNNGGDIAVHLAPGAATTIGVVDRPDLFRPGKAQMAGRARITAASPVRGIATSGWRGRSQSLGIADAVTVLARSAAEADAAATMIANAVDIDHSGIARLPAREVKDDSDLANLLVTVAVGPLPPEAVADALANGAARAQQILAAGLIEGALLVLQGEARVVGTAPEIGPPERSIRFEPSIERPAP